jgi:hypothetical protein
MTHDQAGGFELGQNPINRGESDFFTLCDESVKNLLRAKVTIGRFTALENFQNLEAR